MLDQRWSISKSDDAKDKEDNIVKISVSVNLF